jgi:hypothetical protein
MSLIICSRHEREVIRALGVDVECPYCYDKTRKVIVFEAIEQEFVPSKPLKVIRERIVENRVLTIFCPKRCKVGDEVFEIRDG